MDGIGTLYSHRHTITLALTSLPADYPDAFSFVGAMDGGLAKPSTGVSDSSRDSSREDKARSRANTAIYEGRGWCATELALGSLVKLPNLLVDLGKFAPGKFESLGELLSGCMAWRRPPLLPSAFDGTLQKLSFADKDRDLPLVSSL